MTKRVRKAAVLLCALLLLALTVAGSRLDSPRVRALGE